MVTGTRPINVYVVLASHWPVRPNHLSDHATPWECSARAPHAIVRLLSAHTCIPSAFSTDFVRQPSTPADGCSHRWRAQDGGYENLYAPNRIARQCDHGVDAQRTRSRRAAAVQGRLTGRDGATATPPRLAPALVRVVADRAALDGQHERIANRHAATQRERKRRAQLHRNRAHLGLAK
jgi:hypothetical protein